LSLLVRFGDFIRSEGLTPIWTDDTDLRTGNGKGEIRGLFTARLDDETVRRAGRDDVSLGWEERLAGDGGGIVLIFFGGRVGGEPGLLVFDEFGGLFAEIADGFEGQLAGDVVGLVVGRAFQV
jgi:hypothetical protein